ncbi:hypothetical protein EDC01DRAFT_632548 [Geopyxis carbonaria]|nr:hypothetical protein EDC01DRAFT_632548 [Geopyxis carbonaria]
MVAIWNPNRNELPCGPTTTQVEVRRKKTLQEQDAALDAINAMIWEFDDLPTAALAPPQSARAETKHVRHKTVMVDISNPARIPRKGAFENLPKETPINHSLGVNTNPLAPSRMLHSRLASMPTTEESSACYHNIDQRQDLFHITYCWFCFCCQRSKLCENS